jgi:VWFA-related protein
MRGAITRGTGKEHGGSEHVRTVERRQAEHETGEKRRAPRQQPERERRQENVERRLQASDVTLYMIGQGRGVTHDYLRKVMQRLTVPTGGRAFTTDNIDALQGAFEELLEELSNQYLLGYQPTNDTRDDSWREIKVEIDGQRNIRARQGYRAPQWRKMAILNRSGPARLARRSAGWRP